MKILDPNKMEELIDLQAKAQEVIEAQDGWKWSPKWKERWTH